MASNVDDAFDDANDAATGGLFDRMVHSLATRMGGFASASAVYGDPVDQEGVTVVPVARVRWGFGSGAGMDTDGHGTGEPDIGGGGGGLVSAHPVGYIELRDGEAEFRPIKDSTAPALIILAAGAAAWLVLRGLKSLFR
ncbi:sporulation protein [bacterium]|jgi:uncharacterized spore protein YtfJ|nr:sporulation protein [bacterium]